MGFYQILKLLNLDISYIVYLTRTLRNLARNYEQMGLHIWEMYSVHISTAAVFLCFMFQIFPAWPSNCMWLCSRHVQLEGQVGHFWNTSASKPEFDTMAEYVMQVTLLIPSDCKWLSRVRDSQKLQTRQFNSAYYIVKVSTVFNL